MNKKPFEAKPEGFWEDLHFAGYDGYDIMGLAKKEGWKAESAWGAHGWDLGSWPYVIVYFKGLSVVLYVEGDITQYDAPDIQTRNAIVDDIAFFYWKHAGNAWVKDFETVEEAPGYLKGPYNRSRHDEKPD